jgi:SAM-dependent methyltransferase
MRSYVDVQTNAFRRAREAIALFRFHARDIEQQVDSLIANLRQNQSVIERHLGAPLVGKKILEIGPGQLFKQARFFGASNDVTAIDIDDIQTDWSLKSWARMLRSNGPIRFLKSLVRKAWGYDRKFVDTFCARLPAARNASIRFVRKDAARTDMAPETFDCIMSYSVFEHLPAPEEVLRENIRLLREGGVIYHVIHLYTSDSGAHDPRSFDANHPTCPYWCHLRPDVADQSTPNCYVNKIRLHEWRELLERELPGVELDAWSQGSVAELRNALAEIRAGNGLAEYGDEELLTVCLAVAWKKPSGQ